MAPIVHQPTPRVPHGLSGHFAQGQAQCCAKQHAPLACTQNCQCGGGSEDCLLTSEAHSESAAKVRVLG